MVRLLPAILCVAAIIAPAGTAPLPANDAARGVMASLVAKPNPPQGVAADVSSHQLTVSWLVFSDDGWGGPIDQYQVTVITPANQVLTKFSTTSPVTFTDLRHGTHHYYVGAHNADGWGSVSPIASTVVPSEPDRMAVPRASSVEPDKLLVTWVPPGSDGESPITGYRVIFDGEAHDEPASPVQASYDAPGGTKHSMQVCARNQWGLGECSGTHYAAAKGTPGPPKSVTATVTGTTVSVAWAPPDNDGGRAIHHYRVRVFSGAYEQQISATGNHIDVSGLRPNTDYFAGVTTVGNDPSDDFGTLSSPEYKVTVHTAAASETSVPTVTITGGGKPAGESPTTGTTTRSSTGSTASELTGSGTYSAPSTGNTPATMSRSSTSVSTSSGTSDSDASTAAIPEAAANDRPTALPSQISTGSTLSAARQTVATPSKDLGMTPPASTTWTWIWWVIAGVPVLSILAVWLALRHRRSSYPRPAETPHRPG